MPDMEYVPAFGGDVLRTKSDYLSPVLASLSPQRRPTDSNGCQSCPDGAWYMTSHALYCHCAARRYISWSKDLYPVITCDDREAALAKLASE